MKKIILLLLYSGTVHTIHAQQVVMHPDLIAQQSRNTAYKMFWSGRYSNTLQNIREHRNSTLASMTGVEQIQQKIFNSLTQVQQGLQDGKTIWYIPKKSPIFFPFLKKLQHWPLKNHTSCRWSPVKRSSVTGVS